MKKLLTLFGLSILVLAACKKKDTNGGPEAGAPVITIHTALSADTICGEQEDNVLKISVKDTLRLSFTLHGETELSQYKIDVHENQPCHHHEHGEMPPAGPLDEDHFWHVSKVVDLSVKHFEGEEIFVFEDGITLGNYHLTIKLIDKNGKEAPEKELNVVLLD